MEEQSGIWFLKHYNSVWQPAGNCGDPGYRTLREKEDIENYLSKWRRQ